MDKQRLFKLMAIGVIAIALPAIPIIFLFAPEMIIIESITSGEVEEILYERVEKHNQAIEKNPALTKIVVVARTDPHLLADEELEIFLANERRLFGGWEIAWHRYQTGHLSKDRWKIWDQWFIDEARRCPEICWTENRKHFSKSFLLHVDRSI
jgi:hypothetical protein